MATNRVRLKFAFGEIVLERSGFEEMVADLNGIAKRSTNVGPVFQKFQPYWFDAIAHSFEVGGDPVEWPELSEAYAGWKESHYPGKPLMRRSDDLYESLTNMTSNTIWQTTPKTVTFGTRIPYFTYHQEGLGNNPVRETLNLPAEAASILNSMLLSYVATGRPKGPA